MDTRGRRLRDWNELARDGVRFDTARPAASWTLPSHASMFTGQWPHRLSVDWDRGLDDSFPTLAEFLARHGYATAGFVANTYYCNARYGLDRGFARYEDFHENQTISLFEAVRCTSLGKCLLGLMGYSMDFAPAEKSSRKTAATMNQDALRLARPAPIRPPILSVPELLRRSRSLRAARGGEQAVWLVCTAEIRTGQDAQESASA